MSLTDANAPYMRPVLVSVCCPLNSVSPPIPPAAQSPVPLGLHRLRASSKQELPTAIPHSPQSHPPAAIPQPPKPRPQPWQPQPPDPATRKPAKKPKTNGSRPGSPHSKKLTPSAIRQSTQFDPCLLLSTVPDPFWETTTGRFQENSTSCQSLTSNSEPPSSLAIQYSFVFCCVSSVWNRGALHANRKTYLRRPAQLH